MAIPLTSAGSVGYLWVLTVGGDTGAVDASTGPDAVTAGGLPAGGSLPQALFVVGRAVGHSTIGLRLMRVPGQPAREAHDIEVTVTP